MNTEQEIVIEESVPYEYTEEERAMVLRRLGELTQDTTTERISNEERRKTNV